MTIKVVSWNIAKRREPWHQLLSMDANIALLQEAGNVPPDVAPHIEIPGYEPWEPWEKGWYDRYCVIARLSDRVKVDWFRPVMPHHRGWEEGNEFAVSDIGTIAAARVMPIDGGEGFIAVSMYARWLSSPSYISNEGYIYSDRSAHRIISDLSSFIDNPDPSTHRILAAGDLNMIYGATEKSRLENPAHVRTVTDRMDVMGLEFLGPQHPNGRRACPASPDVPTDTRNVPTYYTSRQSPATVRNQLDYVFASRGFHESVHVCALNSVEEWGASDHSRIMIEIQPT